jgi:molybdopterin converting factor small subunit
MQREDLVEIEVRLFAGLRDGRFKKRTVQVRKRARLRDVLADLDIPEEEVGLPLVNGTYSELSVELSRGDVLSIFPAVGGG